MCVGQATEIYTKEYEGLFSALPSNVRRRVVLKIRDMGERLPTFPHERLQGREEYRVRVGDYRVIYEFDASRNEIYLLTIGHRRDVYR